MAAGLAFALGAGTVALSDGPDEAPAHAAPAAKEIARFSGTGPQATPAFTVDAAWELQWQSDSEVVLSVYRAIDGVRSGAPSKMAGGSGSALQPDPGSYLVEVMATGTWTITVVQPR